MSAEKKFYGLKAAGREYKTSPSLEEFASWAENDFTNGRYQIISEFLEKKNVGKLLEIGCGGGSNAAYMKKYADLCVGMDLQVPPHLETKPYQGIEFVCHNANDKFPFKNAEFEVVVAMMVMEHVFDPFFFTEECARMLKTHGTLFINVPLLTSLKSRLTLLFGNVPTTSAPRWYEEKQWDGGHLHYFSLSLICRLLEDYGFEILKVRGVGKLRKLKSLLPTILAQEISLACRKK